MNPLAATLLILGGVALLGIVALVFYRLGYIVRDNEAVKAAREQVSLRRTDDLPTMSDLTVITPAPQRTKPTAPTADDNLADLIVAKMTRAMVGNYTVPLGHEDLAGDIVTRLRALPMPIRHREVVEAIVLEHPGRHSPEWVAGTALQRTKTHATGEYRVLATVEPKLLCLDGLVEPVATDEWAYPEPVGELAVVGS